MNRLVIFLVVISLIALALVPFAFPAPKKSLMECLKINSSYGSIFYGCINSVSEITKDPSVCDYLPQTTFSMFAPSYDYKNCIENAADAGLEHEKEWKKESNYSKKKLYYSQKGNNETNETLCLEDLFTEDNYYLRRTGAVIIHITEYSFYQPSKECEKTLKNTTFVNCEKLVNKYSVDKCKSVLSLYNSKVYSRSANVICANSYYGNCYQKYAFIMENEDACGNITNEHDRAVCYRNYAISHDDPSICPKAFNSVFMKDESAVCYLYFALKQNELDACSKILEPDPNRYLCNAIILAESGE